MKNYYISLLVIVALLFSCAPKIVTPALIPATPIPEKTSTDVVVASAENIAVGKTIYENNCGKCHELYNPKKYGSEKWVGILNWMAPKAKLTDDQHKLVYNYLVSIK